MVGTGETGDTGDAWEPHLLDEDEFLREVQSFEFWFEAIEGYLGDRPNGYDPDLVEAELDDAERDQLVTILCNYPVGETAALEASSGLVRLAATNPSQIFMATQVADEARHVEVFRRRLEHLGVSDLDTTIASRANPELLEFKRTLLGFVDDGQWDLAVFAQNVLLETMEDTVFRFHQTTADPVTAQILEGVIADERRHLGFGENDLGRRLAGDPQRRAQLTEVRARLDPLVLRCFEATYRDLGLRPDEFPELGRSYLDAVERLGLGG
ncbi:MAG: long-chain fatty aldehyde decarbonylase [Microthrixaceae bacterium]|nr:long-chain fatty aldehyde decarbonylase [Microthrixaceae bacterium]